MSATRAIVRLARRDVGRSRWRSLLVGLLILLPVMGMSWGISVLATTLPDAEARDTHRMGMADLIVSPGPSAARVADLFPSGTRLEPFANTGGRVLLAGTSANVSISSADLDGLARGIFTIASGRQPHDPSEIAISARVAELAEASIGSRVELEGVGTLQVVGIVEDPTELTGRLVLLDVSIARNAADGSAAWLVGLQPGTDPQPIIEAAGNPTKAADLIQIDWRLARGRMAELGGTAGTSGTPTPVVVVLGGLVLLESALVAAAAFAVSIRRRQRELGLLAAAGAEPRHLAGTVLGEGLVLGLMGAFGGLAFGLIAAAATWPWLDQLTNRRNPPLVVDPVSLGAAAVIGLVAALVAAAVPGWRASRMPVLLALSGRRPASSSARPLLRLGLAIIALAALMTFGGATLSLTHSGSSLPVLLLAGGAMLGTLGFGAVSPWLLERLEGLSARLPLSGRIALRDTARARSRSAPIVTAILASLAATIAIGAYSATRDVEIAANWQPWLAPDQILIEGPDAARAGPDAARAVGVVASSVILGASPGEPGYVRIEAPAARLANPNKPPAGSPPGLGVRYVSENITIGDAGLLRALGAESAIAALDDGAVVILADVAWTGLDRATVIVNDGNRDEPGVELSTHVIVTGVSGGDLPSAVISEATAKRLGLVAGIPYRYVIRVSHPVTDADMTAAAAAAAQFPDTLADASRGPDHSDDELRLFLVIASLLFALTVTGIAVALGEAESRPDQRTLLALGAEPRVRRRITAARAGVLAILAGCLAVPAGLLPVWGLLASRGAQLVIPAPEIVAAVGLLPVLAIGATWLFGRPIPDWSAFRSSTS